jgi:hypothetical protein
VAALLICIMCAGLARAQTTETQSTDYATPEEERLIEQGHIFYPPKKIRPKKAAARDKPRYNSEEQRLINEALTLLGLIKKEDNSGGSVPAPLIEDAGPSEAVTAEQVAPENTAVSASADDPATNSQVESLEEISPERVLAEERSEPSQPEKTKQVADQPPPRQISKDETLQIITQSVGPIEITPSSTVTVSASGFELSDGSSSQRHLFRYGLQRTSRASEQWQLYGSYGVALSDYWLVGGAVEYSKNDSDYSLSSELVNEDKTLSLLTAWGVQKGPVNLPFQTGAERVELSQRSRLTSFAWRPSALPNLVLNIRNWETIASQDNQLTPVDYVVETPTSYDTYRDARSVALGELTGYSAIGLGIPLGGKLTFSQTFGHERLRFRHSNQKLDETASAYRSGALQYRDGLTGVELSSQTGVVEKSTSLSFEREGWRVGATRASSKIGLSDYWSVNVGYRKSFEGPKSAAADSPVYTPSLMNDLSPREFSYKAALEKISSRPREFPRTLLAKVDAGAVTLISSTPKNRAPRSNAGVDQTVSSGAVVTLTGAASSDPDAGQTLTYLWTQTGGTLVTLNSSTAQQPTFTAPTLNVGDPSVTLTFSLVVNDGSLSSTTSTVTVTVSPPAEVITWASSGQIGEYFDYGAPSRSNVSVQLSATSNAGNALTYQATLASGSLPPGVTLSSTGLISGSANAVVATTDFQFKVRAISASGATKDSDLLTIRIHQRNLVKWSSSNVTLLSGDTFASNGISPTSFVPPGSLQSFSVLIIGGGGGGGAGNGGGGGAGSVLNLRISNPSDSYIVSVGVAGMGASETRANEPASAGFDGGASTFGSYIALGGGGGGSFGSLNGRNGGSGGGGAGGGGVGGVSTQVCPTSSGALVVFSCTGYRGGAGGGAHGYFAGGGGGGSDKGTDGRGTLDAGGFNRGISWTYTVNQNGLFNVPGDTTNYFWAAGGSGGFDKGNLTENGVNLGFDYVYGSGAGGSSLTLGAGDGSGIGPGTDANPFEPGFGGGGGGTGWANGLATPGDMFNYVRYAGGRGSDGAVFVVY